MSSSQFPLEDPDLNQLHVLSPSDSLSNCRNIQFKLTKRQPQPQAVRRTGPRDIQQDSSIQADQRQSPSPRLQRTK
jgi:hypothetical protein